MNTDSVDLGFVAGTAVFMVFGLLIAFVLPKLFEKGEELTGENRLILTWIRWLGLTLCFISVLVIVVVLFLP